MTKLEVMLQYVSEHNEFYKKRIKEYGITNPLDITQWPVLTRKELQENRYNMFSNGYKSKYFSEQLLRQSSSGSSGVPVNVYWDFEDYYASVLHLWRKRRLYYGINPTDKYIRFTLTAKNGITESNHIYSVNFPQNILNVDYTKIIQDNKFNYLISLIDEFEPKWLYIQPFILNKLIDTYRQIGKLPPRSISYIESVGALLSSYVKKEAHEMFNVPVVNMYGSEEMNCIAYECPQHNMHIMDGNVFVECRILGKYNNMKGETIITSLTNKAMPLIRYNQGDMIEMNSISNSCQCGNMSQIIRMINGRTYESIVIDGKYELNSAILVEMMSNVNNQYDGIITYFDFIYCKSQNVLNVQILLDKKRYHWCNSVIKTIRMVYENTICKYININLNVLLLVNDVLPCAKSSSLRIIN